MSQPDIHIARLAVTMTRDENLFDFLVSSGNVRDALLYVGLPIDRVSTLERYNWFNSLHLAQQLDYLHKNGMIASFLTEVLRLGGMPKDVDEFVRHIQPLGLDLDEDTNQIRPTTTRPEAERTLRTELGRLLSEIDSSFPGRLEGAWEAYYSDNPDRYRQAVTSCSARAHKNLIVEVWKKY